MHTTPWPPQPPLDDDDDATWRLASRTPRFDETPTWSSTADEVTAPSGFVIDRSAFAPAQPRADHTRRSRAREGALLGGGLVAGCIIMLVVVTLAHLLGGASPFAHVGPLARPTATVTPTATPAPMLQGGFAPSSTQVNLTVEGTRDWAHWGLTKRDDFDHKAGGSNEISDYTATGDTFWYNWYNNGPVGYTWSDGVPTASAQNSTTGVYFPIEGSGLTLTVAADTTPRTLTLYLGVYLAQAHLTAALSDSSAPAFTDAFEQQTASENRTYTLTYRAASPGQKLTITLLCQKKYSLVGSVSLQAAALR